MKSLVVLAPHPQFVEAVREVVEPLGFRVVHRLTVEEAEPLLSHGLAPVCILDLEWSGVQGVWTVERILRKAPDCAVLAFAGSREPEWEEELYLAGARHVFSKPLRGRLLTRALQNLASNVGPPPGPILPAGNPPAAVQSTPPTVRSDSRADDRGLLAVRRFSEILTHSLNSDALIRQFLNLVREMVGVNRSVIFLKSPSFTSPGREAAGGDAWMKAVCAIGLTPAQVECCTLSRESGIGAYLLRTGRLLRRHAPEAVGTAAQAEFESVGGEVAVPILGRGEMVGVAVFDTRVTGQPLTNDELESIFHLLEQVGLGITNIWTHVRLVDSNQLLGDVLRELSNACVVVGSDLSVLHTNKAARRALGPAGRRAATMDFADLPEVLGAKIYQVIHTGASIPAFRYEADDPAKSVYGVSVVPIHSPEGSAGGKGCSALLVMEDRTQAEQLQQLEVEAANLRLVNTMADRLAAEIGNAIVPLSVHHQLFDQRIKEAEFRKTLKTALGDGVRRVNRLATQMRFLYGNANGKADVIPLGELLDEANEEAMGYFPSTSASLECSPDVRAVTVTGRRGALKHSFAEIILNGYQANAAAAKVQVRLVEGAKGNGIGEIGLEFEDSGGGFSEEAARQAVVPFYSKRSVGVGLGLSAVRKIMEDHGGRLEIPAPQSGKHGLVRIFLPAKESQE